MPIFRAFPLFFLLAFAHSTGPAQDSAADDPVRPAARDMPTPAAGESRAEPPSSMGEGSLAPPADALSLYSPDALAELPYVYPLLRMRLTPEMRRETP